MHLVAERGHCLNEVIGPQVAHQSTLEELGVQAEDAELAHGMRQGQIKKPKGYTHYEPAKDFSDTVRTLQTRAESE